MSLKIKDRHDLTLVPTHILRNPLLSLELKGVAAMLCSFDELCCSTAELAGILGVSEAQTTAYIRELQNAGYENIFQLSDHEEATERCAANLKNC